MKRRMKLERRVQEPTVELRKANEQLVAEITQRNLVEAALREPEKLIHAILDNSPNLIFLKDTEGRYLLVNNEFERALRVIQDEIKGKTDDEVFPAEQARAFRANYLRVLQAGVRMEFEEVARQDDGPHASIVLKFPLNEIYRKIK